MTISAKDQLQHILTFDILTFDNTSPKRQEEIADYILAALEAVDNLLDRNVPSSDPNEWITGLNTEEVFDLEELRKEAFGKNGDISGSRQTKIVTIEIETPANAGDEVIVEAIQGLLSAGPSPSPQKNEPWHITIARKTDIKNIRVE